MPRRRRSRWPPRKPARRFSGYVALRLPFARERFVRTVAANNTIPTRKKKILHRVREIRGGKLNDANFESRMRGEGNFAEQMAKLFDLARKKSGITASWPKLTTEHFRRPEKNQLSLF